MILSRMSEFEIPIPPEYHQSEVGCFHPYLKKVLEQIITSLYDDGYKILHHKKIGSIEADLIVKNVSTGKYQLLIEIKRLPGDVNSTRNQLQAQNYVREANPAKLVSNNPYYVLTNIEKTELFRFSEQKRSVDQQRINQGPFSIDESKENKEAYFEDCINIFHKILEISIQDSGDYVTSNRVLNTLLSQRKGNYSEWHKTFVTTGYEYIRGALSLNSWNNAITYKQRPEILATKGNSIDFQNVFKEPLPESNQPDLWEQDYLEETYKNGVVHKSGKDLSQVSFSIIANGRENEGLVPTDLELARLLSLILNKCLDNSLPSNKKICDPAAGTGSLLSELASSIPGIQPSQIWANEIEEEMMEPLSLVLGLNFPESISQDNSPKVTNNNVLNLTREDFQDVSILALNPPFLSGVRSSDIKQQFSERIRELNNVGPKLNVGQIGLEALFLELIMNLVPDETLVGLVFPKQFLLGRGVEANELRKYIVEDFNLKYIINYPGAGLFEDVVKATCLLVGQKNISSEKVRSIQISQKVSDIDLDDFQNGLGNVRDVEKEVEISYGAKCKTIKSSDLLDQANDSWLFISKARIEAEDWINENFADSNNSLSKSEIFSTRRGRIGNQGGSDLVFPDSNLKNIIPSEWLKPTGLRWVKSLDEIVMDNSNAPETVLVADPNSYKVGESNYSLLYSIVETYKQNIEDDSNGGSQSKKEKSVEKWISILEKEANHYTEVNTVLLPRNIRKRARAFITDSPIYTSTNVIEAYGGNSDQQYLLLSWVLSVFAQLHLEVLAKDQEGARKLEVGSQSKLLIPDFNSIEQDDILDLMDILESDTTFINLYDIDSRALDRKWAEILWPDSHQIKLKEAVELLGNLVYERNPR